MTYIQQTLNPCYIQVLIRMTKHINRSNMEIGISYMKEFQYTVHTNKNTSKLKELCSGPAGFETPVLIRGSGPAV